MLWPQMSGVVGKYWESGTGAWSWDSGSWMSRLYQWQSIIHWAIFLCKLCTKTVNKQTLMSLAKWHDIRHWGRKDTSAGDAPNKPNDNGMTTNFIRPNTVRTLCLVSANTDVEKTTVNACGCAWIKKACSVGKRFTKCAIINLRQQVCWPVPVCRSRGSDARTMCLQRLALNHLQSSLHRFFHSEHALVQQLVQNS